MTSSDSGITFDTTALEQLVTDPQGVLQNEQSFWADNRAQVLSRRWAEVVGYETSYESWRTQVRAWAEILAARGSFARLALPHICSYLPPGTDLGCTIRFTAFIPARAFAVEDIVFNVAAKYWNNNPANIPNQIIDARVIEDMRPD